MEKFTASGSFLNAKTGSLIPTEVNISLLRNKQGEITGFIRNIHDLSEKERLQNEIIEKKNQISLLQKEIIEYYGPENIVGKSPAMQNHFPAHDQGGRYRQHGAAAGRKRHG